MVRFKNRYIIAQLPLQSSPQTAQFLSESQLIGNPAQKTLLAHIKHLAQQYGGQLLLAKISYSLQIKYLSHGYTVVRVPRDHCQELVGTLFCSGELRVRWVSGTLRKVQRWLLRELRGRLGRELEKRETDNIMSIDYS